MAFNVARVELCDINKPKTIINHKDFYIYHTLNAEWDVDDDNRVDAVLYPFISIYSGIVFEDVRG